MHGLRPTRFARGSGIILEECHAAGHDFICTTCTTNNRKNPPRRAFDRNAIAKYEECVYRVYEENGIHLL